MKWSWRVGRIAGIDIHVHATFPLLFAWIGFTALRGGATPTALLYAFGLILTIFAVVVLHEYAHALTARRFGIATRDITLLPIGGVARLERMPRDPRQELLVSLAGPAVNVVLALILLAVLALTGGLANFGELAQADGTVITADLMLAQLLAINISLAVFNLLPAFPLDGGRALRALIAWRTGDHTQATVIAARAGRVFALIFGLAGLFVLNSPMLVLIGLFVWLAAAGEQSAAQTTAALADVPLTELLVTDVNTLTPKDPLSHAAELTIQGFQEDFPVIDHSELVGMLNRNDLVRGLAKYGNDGTVESAMRRDFERATESDTPEAAMQRLAAARGSAVAVMRGPRLVGLLTSSNVMDFLMIRAAVARTAVH